MCVCVRIWKKRKRKTSCSLIQSQKFTHPHSEFSNTNSSHFSHLIQNVVTNMTMFYAGFSFPNGLDHWLSHSFFFFSFLVIFHHSPHLSELCSPAFLLPSFFPSHLSSSPSLGIGGNLQRCRLMTAETCVGHSGLVSGNMPGIQSRTSDIFLLYKMMSSEQLNALIICLKLDRTAFNCPDFLMSLFHYTWHTSTLLQKEYMAPYIWFFVFPESRKVLSVCRNNSDVHHLQCFKLEIPRIIFFNDIIE